MVRDTVSGWIMIRDSVGRAFQYKELVSKLWLRIVSC